MTKSVLNLTSHHNRLNCIEIKQNQFILLVL